MGQSQRPGSSEGGNVDSPVKKKATPDLVEITPAVYAERHNWSRWRAWKQFRRWESEHGDYVVKRRGRVLYTTAEGLIFVGEHWEHTTDPRVLRRIADLEAQVHEANGRITGAYNEFSEFRRQANAWFKRERTKP